MQQTQAPPTSSAPSSGASDDSDDEPAERGKTTDVIPQVPLPEPAGEATDDVKDLADSLVDELPLP